MAVKSKSKTTKSKSTKKKKDDQIDDFGVWMGEYLAKRNPDIKRKMEEREAHLIKMGTLKPNEVKKSTAKKSAPKKTTTKK